VSRNINHCPGLLVTLAAVTFACGMASGQVLPKNKPIVTEVVPVAPAVTVSTQPVVPVVGETAQPLQATRAADMGLWFSGMANNGLTIADLANNSAFTNAGFRVSDQIVSINGQPVRTEAQFVQAVTSPTLGTQPVQTLVVRNGQQHTLTLSPTAVTQGIVTHDPLYQYGLVVDDSHPDHIVVRRVYPRTAAYYAGLREGDVITTFGGQRVTSISAFSQALNQANTAAIPMQITRSGITRDMRLEPVVVDSSVRTALKPNFDASTSGVIETRVQTPVPVPTVGGTVVTAPAPVLPVSPPITSVPAIAPPVVTPVPTPAPVVVPAVPTAPIVVP